MENVFNLTALVSAVVSILGAVATIMILFYKVKPEVGVMKATEESSFADASESIASGAKISNELLLQRIDELSQKNKIMSEKLDTLQRDFDKVRIELGEWQDWARRLSHQVKSLGHEPVAFRPVKEEINE